MTELLRYRKRPVVIEAYQTSEPLDIETLEGTMHASPGDWIITGLRGEKYPCKPDIFAASYEPADDAPARTVVMGLLADLAKHPDAALTVNGLAVVFQGSPMRLVVSTADELDNGDANAPYEAFSDADGPDGVTEAIGYGTTPIEALRGCAEQIDLIENGEGDDESEEA